MRKVYTITLSKQARKALKKLPLHVALKLQLWINAVGHFGLHKVRTTKGYHDEPLKGDRPGQRSIRLNKAYRAIYVVENNNKVYFIKILEVNKHEY